MTVTLKGKRAAAASATAEECLQSKHKSVAKGKEVEEDDATSDSKKRKRDIADWIGQHREPPSINSDGEAEGKEKDAVATQESTEYKSSIEKYEEGRE